MANKIFEKVAVGNIKVNHFDLSHEHKTTLNPGYLYPIAVIEALPNDRMNVQTEGLVRMMPLLAPMMHKVDISFHWWFVPNRILWPNWEKFITNTSLTDGGVPPAFPTLTVLPNGSNYTPLMNRMGIPDPTQMDSPDTNEVISAMPFAAYQMIYNENYRDQNLIAPVDFQLTDGSNDANMAELTQLRRRAWEHDYLTAALPEPQKGDPVIIPVTGFDDVRVMKQDDGTGDTLATWNTTDLPGSTASAASAPIGDADPALGPNQMYAETSTLVGTQVTVNDIRTSNAIQRMFEKWMRAGSRYTEMLRAFFKVNPQDSRLDRPEFIGGNTTPINISEVLNTTGTVENPQGNMSGHGIAYNEGRNGFIHVKEHGIVMCLCSIRPKTAYQNGIPKLFMKTEDCFQYAVSELAHLGEQEVFVKEVAAFTSQGNNTFGYNPRFQENRFQNNMVTGEMQTSLAFWTWGRKFDDDVQLDQQFIECNPDEDPFAVEDGSDKFVLWAGHKVHVLRVLPKFAVPSLL